MRNAIPRPYKPIKPGDLIQEELDERGWSQSDLAAILQRPSQAINEVIVGKKAITPETAVALGAAFGTSAQYWLNLESAYRLDLLAMTSGNQTVEPVSRRANLYSIAPVQEMLKRNWISPANARDLDDLERELCVFFEVDSLANLPDMKCAARKTGEGDLTSAQSAWVFMVKKRAKDRPFSIYNKDGLLKLAEKLSQSSTKDTEIRAIPEKLAQVGVSLVLVEAFPRTKIDGIAFWVDHQPVIGLSLRLKRIDYFFFTLLHEIAHVVHEDSLDGRLDIDIFDPNELDDLERCANEKAKNWIIPPGELDIFKRRCQGKFSGAKILEFSERFGVNPALIVGRLHHEGLLPYSHHRQMLGEVKSILDDLIFH